MCHRLALAAAFALVWSGCGDDLARQSAVTSLRILAVAAEPPEAAPGERVELNALWALPDDAFPVFVWSHCPALSSGAIDRCAGPGGTLPSGYGMDQTFFVPSGDAAEELIRLTVCAPALDVDCAGATDSVTAAKRVVVGSSTAPNRNPTIASFTVSLGAGRDDEALVSLDAAEGSAETTPGGTEEELFVSWFATAGTFAHDRSFAPGPLRFEGTWTPPGDTPADVHLWAVLRDGRGGIAWADQTVVVP